MIVAVGTDLIEIERVDALMREYSERAAQRVFTRAEMDYCLSCHRPAEHFAARFAAKEAALKALGTGWAKGIGFTDVEVRRADDGQISLVFHNKAFERLQSLGVERTHISMTHSGQYAMATVIFEA